MVLSKTSYIIRLINHSQYLNKPNYLEIIDNTIRNINKFML